MSYVKLYYVDANGIEHLLNDGSTVRLMAWQGFGLEGLQIIESRTPYRHGATPRGQYLQPREMVVALGILTQDFDAWQQADRNLRDALKPFPGEGVLKWVHGSTVRAIRCYMTQYAKDSHDKKGPGWGVRLVHFHAPDPFFYDPNEVVVNESLSAPPTQSFPRSFPLSWSGSNVDIYVIVQNDGDVEAWPVMRVDGPSDNPIITNETTGKSMSITQAQDAGDYIEIDMDNGTVEFYNDSAGTTTNILENLSNDSEFFPLVPGENVLHVSAQGMQGGTFTVRFYAKYQSV